MKSVLVALRSTSPMTAFRRLSELGYLSSYNHAGRYYTLAGIPQFDDDGIWLHDGVGFSRHGTLKATVPVLVSRSVAGLFHRDLQSKLQVRVHNTLLDLVQAKLLRRELLGDEFLYVSAVLARARTQLAKRRAMGPHAGAVSAAPPPSLVLEILLEVIHAAGIRGDPDAVAARLVVRGVAVSVAQVHVVFREHDLPVKKTPPSRSLSSRR